jgi:hypothetical protein
MLWEMLCFRAKAAKALIAQYLLSVLARPVVTSAKGT